MINPLNVKRLLATNMELHAMVRVGVGGVRAEREETV